MIDITLYKEYTTALQKEIERIVERAGSLRPENFNCLSIGMALNTDILSSEIPIDGLNNINGVDYEKIRQITAYLKANRSRLLDKKYDIASFDWAEGAVVLQDEEGVEDSEILATRSVNLTEINIKVPDGWDGRRALITWAVKKEGSLYDIVDPDINQQIGSGSWFLDVAQSRKDKEGADMRSVGVQVYPNQSTIKIALSFDKNRGTVSVFPGMFIVVRYYRSGL